MYRHVLLAALIAASALSATEMPVLAAAHAPDVDGTCVETTIIKLDHRFEGEPGSGSYVEYASGVIGVDHFEIPQVGQARVGDPVELCQVPPLEGCVPGDDRGKLFAAVDLRTQEYWELFDPSLPCSG